MKFMQLEKYSTFYSYSFRSLLLDLDFTYLENNTTKVMFVHFIASVLEVCNIQFHNIGNV